MDMQINNHYLRTKVKYDEENNSTWRTNII